MVSPLAWPTLQWPHLSGGHTSKASFLSLLNVAMSMLMFCRMRVRKSSVEAPPVPRERGPTHKTS